ISGGTMNGNSSTGSNSSANRVRTAMAPKIVPTATNPMVASAMTPRSPGRIDQTLRLKNKVKSGRVTSSTAPTKARLASSFPKNTASRGIGARSIPSIAPFSRSTVKARFIATIAASANVTQRTLGAIVAEETAVGSRAKLKITRTSAAKTIAVSSAVRLLNSARISLPATAKTRSRDRGTDQTLIALVEQIEMTGPGLVHRPPSVDEYGHPRDHVPDLRELVGHQENSISRLPAGLELGLHPVHWGGIESGERLIQ